MRIAPKSVYFLLLIASSCLDSYAQSAALIPGSPAFEKVSEKRLLRIDTLIQTYIDSNRINGGVAFIARNGKIIYHKAFGIDDPGRRTPVRTDAIYRIASQTKAITSVALMILFEEGKFLLDDQVGKYIPEFANAQVIDQYNEKDTSYTTVPARRQVTIRDLLTHTSGIGYAVIGSARMKAIYAKHSIPVGFVSDSITIGTEIRKLGKLPLQHHPGERFTYGLNTDVAGYLIEVLSGMTLDEFLRQRLFKPLGMNDTYFYLPDSKHNRLVTLYSENKEKQSVKYVNPVTGISTDYPKLKGTYYSGGAGLSSTVKDYAIFLQMLLNGGSYNGQRILARRTVDLITSNQIGDLNIGVNKFGLGFEITTERGQAKLGVTEGSFSWGGYFGTQYWADPKEQLVCLLFLQQSPLSNDIQDKFKVLVYQSLQ